MANQQNQQNAVPVAAPAEVWTENPHQGNFNPGTKSGEVIFKMKTKGLADDNKIEMIPDNAAQFRRLLQAKAASFGSIATRVLVAFDNAGNVTEYRSLITQYSSIDMDVLQRNVSTPM